MSLLRKEPTLIKLHFPFRIGTVVFSMLCMANIARSDALNVQGEATGQFASSLTGLTYSATTTPKSFNVTTDAAGNYLGVDLGTFTYVAPLLALGSTTFTSTVTITVPATDPGSRSQSATVNALAVLGYGVATINFSNTPLLFNFADSQGSGSFQITLRDVAIWDLSTSGGSSPAHLWADISNAVRVSVTEPFPVELLLSLLVGVGYVLFQRIARSG